jgi:cobalt-zinc-cadmium efflux system membrane fusion protein
MTRLILTGMVLASLSVGGCREHERSADHADVLASTPSGAHTTPHAEDDLHIAADTRRDLRITTAVVTAGTRAEQLAKIPGEIRVNQNAYAEVGSPVAGRVGALRAGPGQHVREGDTLIEIRSTEAGRARAGVAMAAARRTLARQAVARARSLVTERIAPERELQQAEADLSAAEAEVEGADTMLRALGVSAGTPPGGDVSSFTLRSPISGVILDREATLGQMVDPSNTLFRVADLSRVWLVLQAFERDALRIVAGSSVQVVLPALPGTTRTGRVTWIGQMVSSESHTLPVRIELPNTDGILRPGMTASALVPLTNTTGRVLTVPAAALQRVADGWVAFVPRGDDEWHFEVRPVGRGRDLGTAVEILSGLAEGDRVVVDGAFVLKAEAEKARGSARGVHTH